MNFNFLKNKKGMTYVELIVVLGIFSVLSSVAVFNYGAFQAKVDIKNLASDIALEVVKAQKASLSGALPPLVQQTYIDATWKPSYGVYFNTTSDANKKKFIYFVDLGTSGSQNNLFGDEGDVNCSDTYECLSEIDITKNNSIASIEAFYQNETSETLADLTVTFSRPDSGAIMNSTTASFVFASVNYVQINIISPNEISSSIKLYPSGRIEVN